MNRLHLLLLSAALLFSFACTRDDSGATPDGGSQNGHKVSVESALADLHSVLGQIDGRTRGGSSRSVVSVSAVKAADMLPPMPATYKDYGSRTVQLHASPILQMTWDQGAPYNKYCPSTPKLTHGYVGCTAVAIGQMLASEFGYRKSAPTNYIADYWIDWNTIFSYLDKLKTRRDKSISNSDRSYEVDAVATLLRAVGAAAGLTYRDSGSAPNGHNLTVQLLSSLGYKNVSFGYYNTEKVKTMAFNGASPVYVCAENTYDRSKAHAWVIDGGVDERRTVKTYNMSTSALIKTEYEYRNLLHCNFGYDGYYDGYYVSKVFDLTKKPELIYPEFGDVDSGVKNNTNYSSNIWMITYTL